MPTRELILGGEGLIGGALAYRLRAQGSEVATVDLRSGFDLRRTPPRLEASDRVWFLAWDTGGASYLGAPSRQHDLFKANCEISVNVFDALCRTPRPFLFTTSQLAGQPNAYGLTKLMAEVWARQLGGTVVRLWNVYGWERPDERSHVVTDLVLRGLEDGVVRTRTHGAERRRFLYKDDCAEALQCAFDGSAGDADVAGPEWIRIADLAARIGGLLGVPVELGREAGQEALVEPTRPVPGWSPRTTLDDGLRAIVAEARAYRVGAR